jgi:hypothetical protein
MPAKMRAPYRLLALCIMLVALAAGLAWLTCPSPAIATARSNYAKLRIGMSVAEVYSILGPNPSNKDKLYGEWSDWIHWYATIHPRDCPNPGPRKKLYDWYQWDFGKGTSWATEEFYIGMLLDKGKLVCFWYGEHHDNPAERELRRLASRLSLNTSFLERRKSGSSHENRTEP